MRSPLNPNAVRQFHLALVAGAAIASASVPPGAAAQGLAIEPAPTLQASEFLPPELVAGPNHTVDELVRNDGFINEYRVNTRWGTLQVSSTARLRKWVREVDVAAELARLQGSEEFLKGVDKNMRDTLQGAANLVTDPVDTLGEATEGVGKLFGRVGQSLFGDPRSESEDSALAGAIGFTKKKREYANAFGVDMYSRNPALQKELNAAASSGYLGSISASALKVAIPGGVGIAVSVAGGTDLMQESYRTMAATDLRQMNRERLARMGISEAVVDLFMRNTVFTPTEQTLLVEALGTLDGVEGREELVKLAVGASSPAIAGFRMRQAQLFAAYHSGETPLARFAPMFDVDFGGIVAVSSAGERIFLVPLDHLAWTRQMASFVTAMFDLQWERGASGPAELWFSGTVSAMARRQLESRGLTVRERVGAELAGAAG